MERGRDSAKLGCSIKVSTKAEEKSKVCKESVQNENTYATSRNLNDNRHHYGGLLGGSALTSIPMLHKFGRVRVTT